MAVKVIGEESDIYITREEMNRYSNDYQVAFMGYSGKPPSFEEYVRRRKDGTVFSKMVKSP